MWGVVTQPHLVQPAKVKQPILHNVLRLIKCIHKKSNQLQKLKIVRKQTTNYFSLATFDFISVDNIFLKGYERGETFESMSVCLLRHRRRFTATASSMYGDTTSVSVERHACAALLQNERPSPQAPTTSTAAVVPPPCHPIVDCHFAPLQKAGQLAVSAVCFSMYRE